jgi:hypothetical protein
MTSILVYISARFLPYISIINQGGAMSHTSRFEIPGHDGPVTVIHDGSWDGTATVLWKDADGEYRTKLPARLLVRLGQEVAFDYARNEIISFLESIGSPANLPCKVPHGS